MPRKTFPPPKAGEVVARLHSMRLGKAAELVETAVPDTLAYYAFPEEHWRRIRTNNSLERIMREIRRRTRVVGAFPDGNSAINLAAARLRHIAGTRWSTKRYLNMELLRQRNALIAYPKRATDSKCERFWTLPKKRVVGGRSTSTGAVGYGLPARTSFILAFSF